MDLKGEIMYIPGVGPKRAAMLASELGLHTLEDMINYFPYKYIDRSCFYYIHELDETMQFIQLKGRITSFEKIGEGRGRRLVAHFSDGVGSIDLVWFQGIKWVEGRLHLGVDYIVFGKPSRFGSKLNIAHPELEPYTVDNLQKTQGLQPYYNTTEKMKNSFLTSNAMRKLMLSAWQQINVVPETLPDWMVSKYGLLSRKEALYNIHFPQSNDLLNRATNRLKFEELFYIQLAIVRQTKYREQKFKGYVFSQVGELFNKFYSECLPFDLTGAQKRVIKEIFASMRTGKQMNRLLQGDVGSGKTIVALMCSLIAIDNRYQACIMAPTEILATQHYKSIKEQTEKIGLNVELLTGSTKKKDRERIHAALMDGSLQLLIGTHALLEDNVEFQNLGFVTIDEQHRFGVAQRARLWSKNEQPPHILVMTATPIPRTLAMTMYGDLDVSVLDELPPGRKPIQTYHYFDNKRDGLNVFLQRQIDKGRQVYIVYPLIQESEKMDLKNLEDGYQYICEHFPSCRVSMVHGKMKPAEKDAHMQRFAAGETQIMVATTVIEVGVNVPNASVMVIENAERFGLSQLHQLRGRVGRGADQSYCILMSKYEITNETRKRLSTMTETNDGFKIAEVDLQLRGPGDIEGTQQSGLPFDLKIANLARDGKELQFAREVALQIIAEDPRLELPQNVVLMRRVSALTQNVFNWSVIS